MVALKHTLEYGGLRAVAGLVSVLPYRVALAWGWLQARLSFALLKFRLPEARRRVRLALGEQTSEREITRICRESWTNVVLNGVEMMRVGRTNPDWATRHFQCEEYVRRLREQVATGQGAIVACPHMGSWEMGIVVSRLRGLPVFSIGARQKNPLVNRYIQRLRQQPGIEIVPRGDGAMKQVIRKLRAGQILGILPDVHAREKGVHVPFLGGEAHLHKGMALFAIHTGCPIFPVVVERHGLSRHSLAIHPPVHPDRSAPREQEIQRITAAVIGVIDQAIRRNPGQWFWYNKRWVLDPVVGPARDKP